MNNKKAVIFDRNTGEYLDVELAKPKRVNYTYVGGFVVLSIDGIRLLQMEHVTGRLREVVDSLMMRLRGNVVIQTSLRSLGTELGIEKGNLSRMLRRLEASNVIFRREGTMYLNPHVAFKGTALQQRQAVKEWDGWHRPQPVSHTEQVA
jgi:Firmicute plasmid replication protein (RepL)